MRKIWLRFSDPWWKNVTSLGVFTWNVPYVESKNMFGANKNPSVTQRCRWLLDKICRNASFSVKKLKIWLPEPT
jgi:hypothetical protein